MSQIQNNLWAAPRLSMRWWPVFQRNWLVWKKLAIPSLVGNIAEPLMWLVAFGYGLGSLVGQIDLGGEKVPYILYLASGSICMSAMNAATFEALYSAFSRMHVQKTWDGILNAPVRLDDVVLAEMLWAAYKALFTVTAILGVMLALGISHSPKLLVAWPVLALVGITFSCIALVFNALAKGYDFFTYYFTLGLTPMMFLSGVFFPRDQLPAAVRWLSELLPLTHAVALVRPLFWTAGPPTPCCTWACWWCTRWRRSGWRWRSHASGFRGDFDSCQPNTTKRQKPKKLQILSKSAAERTTPCTLPCSAKRWRSQVAWLPSWPAVRSISSSAASEFSAWAWGCNTRRVARMSSRMLICSRVLGLTIMPSSPKRQAWKRL